MGPIPTLLMSYEKDKFGTHTNTQKMPCRNGGRDQDDASTYQEILQMASKPPEARRKA